MRIEYSIVLDTKEDTILLQYPLHNTSPILTELNTKANDTLIEAKGTTDFGEVKFKGAAVNRINDYYILTHTDQGLVGRKVKNIFQLRPVLEEKEENLKKDEKKESARVYAINETQKDFENRIKSPNYIIERQEKEPWHKYKLNPQEVEHKHLSELLNTQNTSNTLETEGQVSIQKSIQKNALDNAISSLRSTIYNARVVEYSVLATLFPEIHPGKINQLLKEMTVPLLNKHVLLPEYYRDLAGIYSSILERIKEGEGILTLTKKELLDPEERFFYTLEQVAERTGRKYKLKGFSV
ncbi:hypothetical protein NEOKW01_0734 [Nematocida sp. AWRm80]|nr:hypothetical protein NEOKW01_0734 [Nematocida sp. AWRm80]